MTDEHAFDEAIAWAQRVHDAFAEATLTLTELYRPLFPPPLITQTTDALCRVRAWQRRPAKPAIRRHTRT